ncbi:MAG: NADH-quinone oxidoreductase subunit N [Cyclobacteriaceae bacterium]
MSISLNDLNALLPELSLVSGIILFPFFLLIKNKRWEIMSFFTALIFLVNLALAFLAEENERSLFSNQLFTGRIVSGGRIILALAGCLITLLFHSYHLNRGRAEYHIFTLSLQLGAQLTLMAGHAISFILALEIMSISAYALSGFLFSDKSSEAGIKFFLHGSMATAILSFGFSWVYGHTGTLSLETISGLIQSDLIPGTLAFTGLLLIVAALTFKITAAPMHWWAPDVFQAAPYPVIGFLSTIPKISVVLLLARLSTSNNGQPQTGWLIIIGTLAILTLLAGNFPALRQTNARRLLGYSSIGQAGFLLTGLCIASVQIEKILIYYSLAMVTGVILVVYCLNWFEREMKSVEISDFSGLGKNTLLASTGITIGFLSLTGLPPFAGFTAKFLIFTALGNNPSDSGILTISLLVFGILNTAIALFYYIRIPLRLFLFEKQKDYSFRANSITDHVVIIGLSLLLVVLFLIPGWF